MSPPRGLRERRFHAGIEICGPHVGVLIERAADGQQQAVKRGVVGNIGMADGAEQDGVAGLEEVDGAGGHHAAPAEKMLGAPVEILKRKGDLVFLGDPFQDAFGLRDDFGADAIARDYRDRECLHWLRRQFSHADTGPANVSGQDVAVELGGSAPGDGA